MVRIRVKDLNKRLEILKARKEVYEKVIEYCEGLLETYRQVNDEVRYLQVESLLNILEANRNNINQSIKKIERRLALKEGV